MSDYLTLSKEKYVKYMKQKRFSQSTIKSYIYYIDLISEIDSRLYRLSNNQIQDFLLKFESESTQNVVISSLKGFYKVNHPEKRINVFIRPKKSKRIVEILSMKEINLIIDAIDHPKQKALISGIAYHGLRIFEGLNLKYSNVDRFMNLLRIKEGKGRKDRLIPLNEVWIKYLKDYARWIGHKSDYNGYIFQPYSKSSINAILKRKAKEVGIKKNAYCHLIRHSFASALLLQGIDSKFIQEIMGHSDIRTVLKYEHISAKNISEIKLNLAC